MSGSGDYTCERCGVLIHGDKYERISFETYVHKECGPLQLFFHPCLLSLYTSSAYTCNCCFGHFSGSRFRCEQCDFGMCVQCVNKVLSVHYSECEEEHIKHFSHRHPLKLFQKMEDLRTCQLCGKLCLTPAYGCSDCIFYLHEFCKAILPQKIQHSLHSCPLILLTTSSYKCNGCAKHCSGLTFQCGECRFKLCMECYLLSTIKSSDGGKTIQHFLHQDPLTLGHKDVVRGTRSQAYGKPRAELPREIHRFCHIFHPLTFISGTQQQSECKLCHRNTKMAFRSNKCDFHLCFECAFLMPSVKYMAHDHLLTVVENIYDEELKCGVCYRSCLDSPAFRCLECDFRLHLQCGPLPANIKHESHIDSLRLKDIHTKDEEDEDDQLDDDDDFYCDSCEKQRDPRVCVYSCSEGCPFVSHINCVLSEIVASLRGERGDVELRTVGKQITSTLIGKDLVWKYLKEKEANKDAKEERVVIKSLDDILDSLSESEINKLNAIQKKVLRKLKMTYDEIPFTYSEEEFADFMKKFDVDLWFEQQLPEFILRHNQFACVGDLLVPSTLIQTLEDLRAKHGDVSAPCRRGMEIKSLMYFILCSVVYDMRITMVADITEHKFRHWLTCLTLVKYANFEIQFAFDHMESLARAHFGLQSRRILNDGPLEEDRAIKQTLKDIEGLRQKLVAAEAKLEAIQKQKERRNACAKAAATTDFLKNCYSHAKTMKWKHATHGLL